MPTVIAVGAKGCLDKWAARVKKAFKITYQGRVIVINKEANQIGQRLDLRLDLLFAPSFSI